MQIDGRQRREENRYMRGSVHYQNMLAKYERESKLTAHYFVDLKTGAVIRNCMKESKDESYARELHQEPIEDDGTCGGELL